MNIILDELMPKYGACSEGVRWLREHVGGVLEVSEKSFRWVAEQEGFDPEWMDWLSSVLLTGRRIESFMCEVDEKQITYTENPGDFAELFARHLLAQESEPLTPAEDKVLEFDEAFEERIVELVASLLRQGVPKENILLGLKLMAPG